MADIRLLYNYAKEFCIRCKAFYLGMRHFYENSKCKNVRRKHVTKSWENILKNIAEYGNYGIHHPNSK